MGSPKIRNSKYGRRNGFRKKSEKSTKVRNEIA